jgi:hypothetical protein
MDLDDLSPPAHGPMGMKRKRSGDDLVPTHSRAHRVTLVDSSSFPTVQTGPSGVQTLIYKRPRLQEPYGPASMPRSAISNVTDLLPEILQHIFSYVLPTSLGGLLSVCKLFNSLLNPIAELPAPSIGLTSLTLRKQNDVWTRSRNLHLQGYPRPMDNMTELEMWRLLRVRRCQFCFRKARKGPAFMNATPWNGGPGPEDVRTIWPFRVRSCSSCLQPRLVMVSTTDKDCLSP